MNIAGRYGRLFYAAAAMLVPSVAEAQTRICLDRQGLLERFSRHYEESPAARALMNTGWLLEVLRTADGATWSLLVTRPNGLACVIAVGRNWQSLPMPAEGDPL